MLETRTRERFVPWVNQFTSEPLAEEIVDAYFADVSRASDQAKRETFKMLCHDDFTDYLKSTPAPTRVVAGTHDPILTPDFLRQQIVRHIPGARLVQIHCGHEIPVERPAEAAAVIRAFIAGLSASKADASSYWYRRYHNQSALSRPFPTKKLRQRHIVTNPSLPGTYVLTLVVIRVSRSW